MFGRKVLFLAAGYVAGNVVSSLYAKKKGKDFQADVQKAKKDGSEADVFVKGFIDTQKNLFSDLEGLIPKEHKKTFDTKKREAIKLWEKVKKDGGKLLQKIEKESKK